ncbi:ribokinase [Desmospora activa]|uniref:Deoxyribokinase n=1 Tax=Desmospora activa DSM 45169 TaxID=1121389 RepID=A0A2T4ZD47_9BACL|nr:ribokinase [Desmospora activa]PTM59806.1 ribokinase [Desmospora activa DSM 45169]
MGQTQTKSVLVIGSFMMDLVALTPRIPEDGETVIGTSFGRFPGGKGANQAVTAARLGAPVTMVGKLGADDFGDEFLHTLNAESINTSYILRDQLHPTGVGSIYIDEHGNNRIIVIPGSNLQFTPQEVDNVKEVIREAGVLILQLEMNILTVKRAAELAHGFNVPVILNPAPAQELDDELYKKITYLTPNQKEAQFLSGIEVHDQNSAQKAAEILLDKGVQNIILTLADQGALIANKHKMIHIPGFPVEPIDTVGAGDSFNGALAFGIVHAMDLEETVEMANAVGALTVTKKGAIPSLPYYKDVQPFVIDSPLK